MGNCLNMADKQRIQALLELGWSYRRIQRETGVYRDTVARYDPKRTPKPAKVAAGLYGKTGRGVSLSRKNVSRIVKRFCQCVRNFPSSHGPTGY